MKKGSAACSRTHSELDQPRMLSGLVIRDAICFYPLSHGPIAQRLEQGTHNPLVPGSNPGGPNVQRSDVRDRRSDCEMQSCTGVSPPGC
jgi:hypothetical protein